MMSANSPFTFSNPRRSVKLNPHFLLAVIVLLTVGSSEFAAIDSNGFSAYESCFLQESCVEFEAVFESFWIVFTEVCDGMVVGGKSIDEPSDFNVSKAFFFKSSTASDAPERSGQAVKVAIKIKLKKNFRLKRRSSVEIGIMFFGLFFIGRFVTKLQEFQVKLINKGIDYSDGIVIGNGIFQTGEGHLKPVYSLDMVHGNLLVVINTNTTKFTNFRGNEKPLN